MSYLPRKGRPMSTLHKRIVLIFIFSAALFALTVNWSNGYEDMTLTGLAAIKENMPLSALLIGLYFVCLLLYEAARPLFFLAGLVPLGAMLLWEFELIVEYRQYVGLGTNLAIFALLLTIVLHFYLLARDAFSRRRPAGVPALPAEVSGDDTALTAEAEAPMAAAEGAAPAERHKALPPLFLRLHAGNAGHPAQKG